MNTFFAIIGFICISIFLLGALDLIHVRVYVGVEDKVIVSRDKLKDPSE